MNLMQCSVRLHVYELSLTQNQERLLQLKEISKELSTSFGKE